MTLTQIADNIRLILEGGQGTNNEYYSIEQIKFQILYYRALFLRRDAQYDTDVQHHEQLIELNMEVTATAEDYASSDISEYLEFVLKSESAIPQTVALRNSYDLSQVMTAGGKNIPLTRHYQVQHLQYERYTKCAPRAYVKNKYLYVINDAGVRELQAAAQGSTYDSSKIPQVAFLVRGIFFDPRDVNTFNEDTDDFPISPDYIQRITDGLFTGELKFMRGIETPVGLDPVTDEKSA